MLLLPDWVLYIKAAPKEYENDPNLQVNIARMDLLLIILKTSKNNHVIIPYIV